MRYVLATVVAAAALAAACAKSPEQLAQDRAKHTADSLADFQDSVKYTDSVMQSMAMTSQHDSANYLADSSKIAQSITQGIVTKKDTMITEDDDGNVIHYYVFWATSGTAKVCQVTAQRYHKTFVNDTLSCQWSDKVEP